MNNGNVSTEQININNKIETDMEMIIIDLSNLVDRFTKLKEEYLNTLVKIKESAIPDMTKEAKEPTQTGSGQLVTIPIYTNSLRNLASDLGLISETFRKLF